MFNENGQTIIDISLIVLVIVLSFVVFFSLIDYKKDQFEQTLKYLAITENAISKRNPEGVGFADIEIYGTKTTLQNTMKAPQIISPIKKIELINTNNTKILEIGDVNCENKIVIPRLIIYENEIVKADFTFCN